MHDIDRTMNLEGADFEGADFEGEREGTFEADFEGFGETDFEAVGESDFENFFETDFEDGFETEMGEIAPLSEQSEIDLAAELLSVSNDQELDQFIGRFIRRAGRGLRRFARSGVGRTLGGMLKGVVKKALPIVGGAVGSFVAPGVGTAIGSSLGRAASNLFEVDLEGMDQEDAQFEIARRWVRLANSAVQAAGRTASARDPRAAARQALAIAARRHAPGLARALGAAAGGVIGGAIRPQPGAMLSSRGGRRSGRWIRRGRAIVLLGA